MQLVMRDWRGRRGELASSDGQAAGWIELGGRREPDRVEVDGRTYAVSSGTGRRRWVLSAADVPADRVEVRRPSRVKLRYELTMSDGRMLEVAPVSRVRRRLAVTDGATLEVVGGFERGGAFRTVWTFDVEPLPTAVRAVCVWLAAAIDREDEASNVAAVGSGG